MQPWEWRHEVQSKVQNWALILDILRLCGGTCLHLLNHLVFDEPPHYFSRGWLWYAFHKVHHSHFLVMCSIVGHIVHDVFLTFLCTRAQNHTCTRNFPCIFIWYSNTTITEKKKQKHNIAITFFKTKIPTQVLRLPMLTILTIDHDFGYLRHYCCIFNWWMAQQYGL